MKGRTPLFAALAAFAILSVVACGDSKSSPTAATLVPGAPSFAQITGQGTLGAEIPALVNASWPKGQATAILAKWDQVLRAIAKEPKAVLKGRTVPGSSGRAELARTISYIQLKATEATPPSGETRDHFIARVVLDMSTYVYGGPSAPVPSLSATSDIAFKLVTPATADTVVTPAKLAGVAFPLGSVVEPTIVVITPNATYYPDNCAGPLDTKLCQYPRFYTFNVFPDVKLNIPAKVQVCHVDAGTIRTPLADHNRFKVAHDKPADSTNYSAGSTIVDNIEILKSVTMNVTQCAANGGTTYTPTFSASLSPLGRAAYLAKSLVSRAATAVGRFLTPNEALAIDVGVGGESSFFSSFAVVDPQSKADLSVATGPVTSFSVTSASLAVGAPAAVQSWKITNVGSGTSDAFTSNVIVATDSALSLPVSTPLAVGGTALLVPFALYTYPAVNVAMPTAPGTYFVGTRIVPAGFDSSATNNWTSVRVVVNAPAYTGPQTVGAQPWTGTGPGIITTTVLPTDVILSYNHTPSGYSYQTWIYTTTAVTTGNYTFNWNYSGLHSWFMVTQHLEAFANGPLGETVVQLVNVFIGGDAGNFNFTGTTVLPLTAGYTWGVRPAGQNGDSSQILFGTVHLTDPVIIP
jgi:hypothetical protein